MSVEDPIETDRDVEELLENLSEHQTSIESFVDAIELLDRSGLIDVLTVLGTHELDNQEQTFEMFSDNENAMQLVQNLTLLVNALSDIDPNNLERLGELQDEAADQLAEGVPESKPGLFGLFRQLRNPETQKGMALFLALLKAVGEQLDEQQRP